jgi:hypothetical protein
MAQHSVFLRLKLQLAANDMTVVDVTQDWFWEGNVVEAIASFLERNGWLIVSKANTHAKERGVDIHATKDRQGLAC